MGLGKAFTRNRPQAPAHNRAITEFAIIDGVAVDGSGVAGSRYRGAMAIPGAWRAANLLADLIGSFPWDAYRERGDNPIDKLPTPPLLDQPFPQETRMNTFSSWALDLVWNGNAVGVWAARDRMGYPTAVLPVPASWVGVRRVDENSYSPLPKGELEYSIGGLTFNRHEMFHVKGPCEPGAVKGMGVLENHLSGGALGLSLEQMRQASNLANHGVPTGYLKDDNPDTTPEDLAANKAAWLRSQRDRTVAALNANMSFEPLSWNPEEMQLIEARRYQLTEIELIFGLPVGWLGGMNSARQYSNIEQDAVNLLKFSLNGHLARFKQALSLAFPRGTRVEPDLDELLRVDQLTRFKGHELALKNRFATINEVRAIERKPPLPPEAVPAEPAAAPDTTDITDETPPEDQP
jgi:HK97 family phage portal protein